MPPVTVMVKVLCWLYLLVVLAFPLVWMLLVVVLGAGRWVPLL